MNSATQPSTEGTPNNSDPSPELVELLTKPINGRLKATIHDIVDERVDELRRLDGFEPLWTAKDVAHALNVSKRTVENVISAGDLQPIYIRGARRFDPDAVRAYVRHTASKS
jgi:excisionase family DNA binding protein